MTLNEILKKHECTKWYEYDVSPYILQTEDFAHDLETLIASKVKEERERIIKLWEIYGGDTKFLDKI